MATAGKGKNGAWFAAGLVLGAGVWLGLRTGAERAPWMADVSPAATASAPRAATGGTAAAWSPPGEGFLVWESNRSGRWRLWTQRLDGSGLRQLSPEEGDRIHCCPHISPDGRWIAWLSLDPGPDRYPEGRPEVGVLRLMRPDGSGQRDLAPPARAYGEHRAAVWHGSDRLAFVDGQGYSVRLSLASGQTERLTARPHPLAGWLVNPLLTHATDGAPTFSLYDAGKKRVTELQAFGGCQPYFTQDGRQGYWIAGAGGPLYRMDLATRESAVLLRKNDPRFPGSWGYIYFPMLSPDRRLLAFGASDGGHDHWQADYDVHVVEVHPETLDLVGVPVPVAPHPATDRFPAVWLDPGTARPVPPTSEPAEETHRVEEGSSAWPADRDRLLFLWERANAPNRVVDPLQSVERSFPVERHGLARLDHHHRMVLGGGTFTADWEASEAIVAGVRETNELTLEATLVPTHRQSAPILTLSGGARDRSNLVLAQEGGELILRLTLAHRGVTRETVKLGRLEPGKPTHLLVSYRPGRLTAWRDGRSVLDTAQVQGDFFRWRPRPLTFGGEARSPITWNGTLEGVAFYGRFLEEDEARENAERYLEKIVARPEIPSIRLRGRLTARSHTPTLREISPYREALAVYEYRVEEVLAGNFDGNVVRVAHWVILDGETLPAARRSEGEAVELTLEPFAANPQLESVFLSEDVRAGEGGLFYEVSGGGAR
jgi:Concanavalin A-like lectin/glucanases superfamily/WD40-like Beta Propeller Repeat